MSNNGGSCANIFHQWKLLSSLIFTGSSSLWTQYMCFASHLVVPGLCVEMINLVICLLPRSSEYPELCVCGVAVWKEDQQIYYCLCHLYYELFCIFLNVSK